MQISGFDIGEKIGEGGSSEVFLATRQADGQRAALKLLHERYCRDATLKRRLLREAEIIGSLTHPNIVKIYRYGTTEQGRFYMVLEYLSKGSLSEFRRYSPRQLLKFMIQVCDGIAYIHDKGIVHRDLKPSNIMFADDGIPRLVDFGISLFSNENFTRLTHTNMVIGTLSYMSPEQQTSPAEVDARSDVYAFGAILYEIFTGKRPIGRFADPIDITPNLPEALNRCILTCLAHSKDDRYPNILMLRDRLVALWKEGAFEEEADEPGEQDFDARVGYWLQKLKHGLSKDQLEARHHILNNAIPSDLDALISLCENSDTRVRLAVIPVFGKLQDAKAVPLLIRQLPNPMLIRACAHVLMTLGDKRAVPPMIKIAKMRAPHSHAVLAALAALASDKELKPILPYLKSSHYAERAAAVSAFEVAESPLYLKDLKKQLKSESDIELKNRLYNLVHQLEVRA